MKRLARTGVLLALLAASVLAGNALAFFSTGGSGSASAAVSNLTVPTISAATAGASSVTLTWGAVTPPGAGSVSYYVTRDGADPAGNCPTAAAPSAALTCKDVVALGAHTYTVTAVWETWTAVSASKSATVATVEVTHFTIAANTTTPAVNGPVNLTITARDPDGAAVTTYTGTHSLVFSGASPSPGGTVPTVVNSTGTPVAFGSPTALTFTKGVATVSSSRNGLLRIFRAGDANIVATEGSITTPVPLVLSVGSGATTKFVLGATTTTPTVGDANDLTITAQDTYGNPASAYTGPHSLIFSTAAASPGGHVPTVTNSSGEAIAFGAATVVEFSAGVAVAAEGDGGKVNLYKSGSTSLKATEGSLTTPNALVLTVAAGPAAKFVLTSSTSTPTAIGTFNLTTTARDAYENTATGYAGAKEITFSGAAASPTGIQPTIVNSTGTAVPFGTPTALNFANGVAAVGSSKNGLGRIAKAGPASLLATDGTVTTPVPLALAVATGTASKLALTDLLASAGTVSPTCFFTCPITGLGNSGTVKADVAITDASGNVASGLTAKTVTVTVTSGGKISGSPLTIPATGPAVTSTEFTYTAPASGSFTHTITAASTGYTSATAAVSK